MKNKNPINLSSYIGTDIRANKKVFLNNEDRLGHTLILGAEGSGKFYQSIVPLVKNDIESEVGVIIIDSRCELAEYAAAKASHSKRKFAYFNPIFQECPTFNPLYGEEEVVINTLCGVFSATLGHLPEMLIKFNLTVLSRAIKVIKRVYGDDANLIDLYDLLYNPKGKGIENLHKLMDLECEDEMLIKENSFICEWFISFYKGGVIDGIEAKKYSIALRQEIWSIINNKLLKNCLIPPRGVKPDIILKEVIEDKTILCTAINERHLNELSKVLSHLFLYTLRHTIGNENTDKNTTVVYLNNAQRAFNEDICNIIPLCKKYSVGLVISAQSPQECQNISGLNLCSYVFDNCSNKIIYPYTKDSDYGALIEDISEKDIFFARHKVRSAHYIIQNSINTSTGIITVDPPKFNEEYDEIDKIRQNYIQNNKRLVE